MNGYFILNEAARLIGMDAADEKLKIIGVTLLNTALADMGCQKSISLSAPLTTKDEKVKEAVKFCLAALIANAIGDTEAAENMSGIYRVKKGELKAGIQRVKDILPKGEW